MRAIILREESGARYQPPEPELERLRRENNELRCEVWNLRNATKVPLCAMCGRHHHPKASTATTVTVDVRMGTSTHYDGCGNLVRVQSLEEGGWQKVWLP